MPDKSDSEALRRGVEWTALCGAPPHPVPFDLREFRRRKGHRRLHAGAGARRRRGRARRTQDRVHGHRQFRRRKGSAAQAPAAGRIRLRRTRRARASRLARVGMRAAGRVRRAGDLGALRRRQGVLSRQPREARIPAGRRAGAGHVQRVVPGPVLAPQGGLPVRLQHAEPGSEPHRRPGDRAQPGPRRALACRGGAPRPGRRVAARREQPRAHAPRLQGRPRDLRLLLGRAARPGGGVEARALSRDHARRGIRQRPPERAAAGELRRSFDDLHGGPARLRCAGRPSRRRMSLRR